MSSEPLTPLQALELFNKICPWAKHISMDWGGFIWTIYKNEPKINKKHGIWEYRERPIFEIPRPHNIKYDGHWKESFFSLDDKMD